MKLRSNPSRLASPGKGQVADSWRDGRSSSARGYNYQWQKARAEYLTANPVCAMRGHGCTLAATVVDHVIPHRGNIKRFWNRDNWQGLCAHCHSLHKQRQELGL